jgi:nucleoside-diphosphate-sugar epimerase
MNPTRILITGANGLIGNLLYAHLAAQPERYEPYGCARAADPDPRPRVGGAVRVPEGRMRIADVGLMPQIRAAVEGMHTVVHLAGEVGDHAGYKRILRTNITGTHNVFEACHEAKVKRVIFASSNQVVFGYLTDPPYSLLRAGKFDEVDMTRYQPVRHDWPTRPTGDYNVSKIYGESLAHVYAQRHGMSCISVRIGWVTPDDRVPVRDGGPAARMLWCSQRDVIQLLTLCIDAPGTLRHDVFFAQSANRYGFADLSHSIEVLGFAPQDDAEERIGHT